MIKHIEHYALENLGTVYDEEAMTALQLIGRVLKKLNETITAFNGLEDYTNLRLNTQDKKIPVEIEREVQAYINDGRFEEAIDLYAGALQDQLRNLLGSVTEGSTTGDAELIDARMDNNGNAWPTAGDNVRMMQKETTNLLKTLARDIVADVSSEASIGWYNATGVFQENSGYRCFSRSVAPGEVYYYGGIFGYDCSGVLCLDSDNNVIKTWFTNLDNAQSHYFENPIVVPPKGVKLLVNSALTNGRLAHEPALWKMTGREMNLDAIREYMENILATLPSGDNLYVAAGTCKAATYINPNGVLVAEDTGKYECVVATVEPGETYRIRGEAHYSNTLYTLCNEAGYPVEVVVATSSDGRIDTVEKDILIPQGVTSLCVAGMPGFAGGRGALCQKLVTREAAAGVWSHLRWACVGDSLTEENTRTTKHYFDYVQDKTGIQVHNYGKSGCGYVTEASGDTLRTLTQAAAGDCDVLTIFGSGNDSGQPLGEMTDEGPDTVCGSINVIINYMANRYPTVKLGIVSPTPWFGGHPSQVNSYMTQYSNKLRELCEFRGIPFLDLFRLSGFCTTDIDGSFNNKCHDTFFSNDEDGVSTHPNEAGHKVLSSHFYAFLQSLIGTY